MHFKFTLDNGLETVAKKSTNRYLRGEPYDGKT